MWASFTHSINKGLFFLLNVWLRFPTSKQASLPFLHCHPLPTYATSLHSKKQKELYTHCTHGQKTKGINTGTNASISLINTKTPQHTHRHTHESISSHLASSSTCIYSNLQERSSLRSQRGIQELRLQCHTLAYTHTCKAIGTHSRMVRDEEQGKVEDSSAFQINQVNREQFDFKNPPHDFP